MSGGPASLLILTPVKNAAGHLAAHLAGLEKLTYPAGMISLGFIESDSRDGTFETLQAMLPRLQARYASVGLWKRDFGFEIPDGVPRWLPGYQYPRRRVLAKARNHLLSRALGDEEWVLWLDVDVIEYPADIIEQLLATGRDIVQPHCVKAYGGETFDRNAWREGGRVHMDQLRSGPDLVRLDAVGGTMLLVKADLHRDGLVFPPFPFGQESPAIRNDVPWLPRGTRGEIETEGLGIMALAMGLQCWGMPNLEILHKNE
ncbi:MAG: hypothetical protein QOK29_2660 [Rhodospirillaceae bacterium]|jgi:hypothetical protein|nr:hypothetical protein [Rhodospirillaceae bacterium]